VPSRFIYKGILLSLPGQASTFIPKDGSARRSNKNPYMILLAILNEYPFLVILNLPRVSLPAVLMLNLNKELPVAQGAIDILLCRVSYDQYPWCPITFSVTSGLLNSSIEYNNAKTGSAIANKTHTGTVVQTNPKRATSSAQSGYFCKKSGSGYPALESVLYIITVLTKSW
jgi:hypothetical protein